MNSGIQRYGTKSATYMYMLLCVLLSPVRSSTNHDIPKLILYMCSCIQHRAIGLDELNRRNCSSIHSITPLASKDRGVQLKIGLRCQENSTLTL
jgi:hypothetical protein